MVKLVPDNREMESLDFFISRFLHSCYCENSYSACSNGGGYSKATQSHRLLSLRGYSKATQSQRLLRLRGYSVSEATQRRSEQSHLSNI